MPERSEYLYRGRTTEAGVPVEFLGPEASSEGGDPEAAVPARHLTKAEYEALSPRNKERVREATNDQGKPLYEPNKAPAEKE